eukprot:TRINITY_DN6695_c0_g1_i3.p1 TRINITY_DN6695_c0_g1~~TRINITY_DN6695_c0_g1_i3.p1  ORF type:complete len:272 (-),score=91.05 TRINITY_DN6695_c0_g1_i3:52-867(-)
MDSPRLVLIPTTPWWPAFCKKINMSASVLDNIDKIRSSTEQSGTVLYEERNSLGAKIRALQFNARVAPHNVYSGAELHPMPGDPDYVKGGKTAEIQAHIQSNVTSIMQMCQMIKTNFASHVNLIYTAHRQIAALLSPRHHALLILQAFSNCPLLFSDSLKVASSTWKKMAKDAETLNHQDLAATTSTTATTTTMTTSTNMNTSTATDTTTASTTMTTAATASPAANNAAVAAVKATPVTPPSTTSSSSSSPSTSAGVSPDIANGKEMATVM